ncbi:unnamed protein product (macronuclear) [Paramecium tetraurelia]|uniref:Transmembrane protein n=1 Tax=Paramecium tetraurelia TaxID=5888 RepID=A0DAU2_PARTE|nr:uncharacterized protein GSPATT00015066001 [Paramecium tetraurelia]CAK80159.1 unnamed protein product [Paramecium tetraurelia]|eukprot:XP_001447556.1 hypothetical protein (macronuclear) [Paramecium tetraurelia strain d4-2]
MQVIETSPIELEQLLPGWTHNKNKVLVIVRILKKVHLNYSGNRLILVSFFMILLSFCMNSTINTHQYLCKQLSQIIKLIKWLFLLTHRNHPLHPILKNLFLIYLQCKNSSPQNDSQLKPQVLQNTKILRIKVQSHQTFQKRNVFSYSTSVSVQVCHQISQRPSYN